jgi:alkanesulfonate monooxygenase SsuD/methylene tetrahydromethanopterin reductase-like flavin-dependent oxidoreductase (luciferase family)
MNFGIQFSQPAVLNAPPVQAMKSYLNLIELASKHGFNSFWSGQHFMADHYLLFQPLTLAARAAAAAPSMQMGTSVLLLPMLNPVEVAEHGATLDAITNGGFILGAGLGYRDEEFAAAGIRREDVIERFEESIEVIRLLWEQAPANYSGRHFKIQNATINPAPTQKPRPPILIGAYALRAIKRAGRISDGWIIPPEFFASLLQKRFDLFRESVESHGTKGTIAMMRAFHASHDPAETRAVEELLGAHFQRKRDWGILKGDEVANSTALDNAHEAAIIGDPDACVRKIEAYRDRYQPDHLILLMGFHGISAKSLERSIQIAGEEILPHFRA